MTWNSVQDERTRYEFTVFDGDTKQLLDSVTIRAEDADSAYRIFDKSGYRVDGATVYMKILDK